MRKEDDLQIRCVTFLTYRYSHLIWNHSPNEGKRTPKQGAFLRKMGMRAGWPDLAIASEKGTVYVEFKTPTGRQEKEQRFVESVLGRLGYVYVICRDYFDFIEICHTYLGPESDPDAETLKKILNT